MTPSKIIRWIFFALALVFFLFFFVPEVKSWSKEIKQKSEVRKEKRMLEKREREEKYQSAVSNKPKTFVSGEIAEKRLILFSGQYQKCETFPKGRSLEFSSASLDYCCLNGADQQVCGNAGEDVSDQLPGGEANTKLFFRSQNGKDGFIFVIVRFGKFE